MLSLIEKMSRLALQLQLVEVSINYVHMFPRL